MSTATIEAVVTWLLSADHVPHNLATRLTLHPPTVHPLMAWRFRGQWTTTYAGELGTQRTRHTTNISDRLNHDGTMEQVIDGTTATSSMEWSEVSGEHSAPFDVVVIDGDAPEPPGASFAAKAARAVVETDGQPGESSESWEGPGQQRVSDEAGVALRRHLDSPHLNRLTVDTQVELSQTHQAPVVVLEFNAQLDGGDLRLVLGPDGTAWGSPPRDDARKAELSEGSAKVVLAVVFWAVAAIAGLFLFVVPGIVAGIAGFVHVRSMVRKRDQRIDQWRDAERLAVRALVTQTLATEPLSA